MIKIEKIIISLLIGICFINSNFAQTRVNDAKTPPMGWNSWNYFGKSGIDEKMIRECMDAMVTSGLRDAGYIYFVIDGGWRDNKLGENGELIANPKKFPNGIEPLVKYANERGLRFGLHTTPGTHDCAGDPVGGYDREEVHIKQLLDWGLDFIKLDRCYYRENCEAKHCWTEELTEAVYRRWRRILDESSADVLFSVSAYKFRDWNPAVCNMSRTTGDISCRITRGGAYLTDVDKEARNGQFFSVLDIADQNNESAIYAQPGYWNDPDMLVTGDNGLTFSEQQIHFALWCIMSSPLLLGNDPRHITEEERSIILNKKAIAINQDTTEQGVRVMKNGEIEYWKKNLSDGSAALLILNGTAADDAKINLKWSDLGVEKPSVVEDVYLEKQLTIKETKKFTLKPHECKFLLLK